MVKCPICGMEFNTQEEHDEHHKEVHGEEIPSLGDPTKGMKCSLCGFTVQTNEDMEAHNKSHQSKMEKA